MNKYAITRLATSRTAPNFAAEIVGEWNRQQYIAQSAATVAGRAAPFPSLARSTTAAPSVVEGGGTFK